MPHVTGRPLREAGPEAPGHEAEKEADAARKAQDEPGVERDDDAGGAPRAAGQIQPGAGGAEPGRRRQAGPSGQVPAGPAVLGGGAAALAADAG